MLSHHLYSKADHVISPSFCLLASHVKHVCVWKKQEHDNLWRGVIQDLVEGVFHGWTATIGFGFSCESVLFSFVCMFSLQLKYEIKPTLKLGRCILSMIECVAPIGWWKRKSANAGRRHLLLRFCCTVVVQASNMICLRHAIIRCASYHPLLLYIQHSSLFHCRRVPT